MEQEIKIHKEKEKNGKNKSTVMRTIILICITALIMLVLFFAFLTVGIGYAVSKTGLMNVPLLSKKYFTAPSPSYIIEDNNIINLNTKIYDLREELMTDDNPVLTINEKELTALFKEQLAENFTNLDEAGYRADIIQTAIIEDKIEIFIHLTAKDDNDSPVKNIYITSLIEAKWDTEEQTDIVIHNASLGMVKFPDFITKLFIASIEKQIDSIISAKNIDTIINKIYISDNNLHVKINKIPL